MSAKKQKNETAPAVVEEAKLPATMDGYGQYAGLGNDQIENNDVSIPRLKVIQAMSPEAKDGLATEGDLLHSITKDILAKKGERLTFIPILYRKEYVLWRDRKSGGGMFARARKVQAPGLGIRYEWDKQNQTFEDKLDGKLPVKYVTGQYIEDDGLALWGTQVPNDPESGPAATETHNYIVCLPDHDWQLIALSLSRTSAKRAKDLNFMIKTATNTGTPLFALKFQVGTVIETADANSWAVPAFQGFGKVKPDDPMIGKLYDMWRSFSSKDFTIHDEQDDAAPSQQSDGGKF